MKRDAEIFVTMTRLSPAGLGEVHSGREWRELHDLLDLIHRPQGPFGSTAGVTVDRYEVPAEDGSLLPLRIYRRADTTPAGVLLYIHGAILLDRDVDACDTMCRRYALGADVAIAAVGYRHAPEGSEVGPVEDCHAALEWLAEYAGDLGLDPARIGIAGDSVGGTLAAGTALLARDRGGPALALQVLVYPMLDDRRAEPGPAADWSEISTHEFYELAWRLILGDDAARRGGATPYQAPARAADLSGLPRTYIEIGELDLLRVQALDYAERLEAAGAEVELHVRPGARHGFDVYAPRSGLVQQAIADRLRVLSTL